MKLKRTTFIISLLPIILSLPIAYIIYAINNHYLDRPEHAVKIIGVVLMILFLIPPCVYLLRKKKASNPWTLSSIIIGVVSILLVAVYLFWISSQIFFPADFLIWSESDFINDILKFRAGYPIYSAQENNESFCYTPGTQILTYFLARPFGKAINIPKYRIVQVIFTLLAAVIASFCCHKLIEMSSSRKQFHGSILWNTMSLSFLFLVASNALTNPFMHNLHNDALAQLISIIAYLILLLYAFSRNKHLLILMAILPTVGFLVKQNLIIWAVLYFIYLAIFDLPRSKKRILIFPLAACGVISAVVALCYCMWGNHFFYWVFISLGKHGISPLRSFQHMLDVWIYIVIGLVSGIVLLRGKNFQLLLGPWLIWLFFMAIEIYTSGAAWILNHIGPGSLIAGCWFWAALVRLWPILSRFDNREFLLSNWLRAGITVAMILFLFSGLGFVRIPLKSIPYDAYRYISDIEREYEGHSTKDVLLDAGTWIYVKDGVIMKDRSPCIGLRGYGETGDFSGFLRRIEEKKYSKILVRDLHSPLLNYDFGIWRKSSGIRQAFLDNYKEIGQIKAVTRENYEHKTFLFSEISILVPKMD
ncbi:MAG: hypothetical protein GY845_14180 [Planctomycetes bacterium]|nr:hypothetical protein [Planctomycetota bacterium]